MTVTPCQMQKILEEYHLLLQENENRLDCLARMEARLAGAPQPQSPAKKAAGSCLHPEGVPLRRALPAGLPLSAFGKAPPADAKSFSLPACPAALAQEARLYRERIAPLLAANRLKMQQLDQAVCALPLALHREVLRLRYLDVGSCRLMPWRQVALRVYGDDDPAALQYIRRLHTQALTQLCEFFSAAAQTKKAIPRSRRV